MAGNELVNERGTMKTKSVLALCLLCAFLMACATTQNQTIITDSYKALAASATVYEGAYPAFLDLCNKGILSVDVKAQGRNLAVKYWAAYHVAADALVAYDKIQDAAGLAKVNASIAAVSQALADLNAYVQPLIVKGGK